MIHRRFGKTVWAVNGLIRSVLECPLHEPQAAYVCPTYKQAKRVAWLYVKQFSAGIPGVKFNSSDLTAFYPNGAKIFLLGSENADSLRGMYLDKAVLDETAQISPVAWSEVIRPALSDRLGGCDFIGTPKGRGNLFSKLYHGVPDMGPDWTRTLLTHKDTNIIDPGEVEALKREMTEDEFNQEFNCSFVAAIKGAFYAKEMNKLDAERKIGPVPWDQSFPVTTAWDLGWSDENVVLFFQSIGGSVRVIDCLACTNTSLPDVIKMVKEKPYQYDTHIAPHDIAVHELGTGMSRLQVARNLGIRFVICPNIPRMDGIKAVQATIGRCTFDDKKCETAIEALRQYRTEFDELKQVYSRAPLHSWESNYADAFRYYVVYMNGGNKSLNWSQGKLDYSNRDRSRSRA